MLVPGPELYRFDDFELEPARRRLVRDGVRVSVAPRAFDVLLCLVRNPGRVVLKDELLSTVWPNAFVEESNLSQHIFALRKALGNKATHIATIPGRGYQFCAPVSTVAEPAAPAKYESVRTTEVTRILVEETVVAPVAEVAPAALPVAATAVPRRRLVVVVAAAISLAFAAAILIYRGLNPAPLPGDHHPVVLGEFQNVTGDPSFDAALKTLLAIDLNQSPFLSVAGQSDIQRVLKLMNRPPSEPLTQATALEVCQRLNDQVVLSGLIANFGRKYLLTLTATDCQSGATLAQTKSVANGRDAVLASVDSVAADVRRRLGESLRRRAPGGQPLELAHTFSLDALRSYSRGLALAVAGSDSAAVPFFEHAIELDPQFAAAWFQLGMSYFHTAEAPRGREALTRASQLVAPTGDQSGGQADDFLRFQILSRYHAFVTGDMHAQLGVLLDWTRLYPGQAEPWIDLAALEQALGQAERGIEPGRRAVALDPTNPYSWSVLCASLLYSGRVDEAKQTCRQALAQHIEDRDLHLNLYGIAFAQHDEAAMREQLEWSRGTEMEPVMPLYTMFAEGRAHAAVAFWQHDLDLFRQRNQAARADHLQAILFHREVDYALDDALKQQLPHFEVSKSPLNVVYADAELGRLSEAEAALKLLEASASSTDQVEYFLPQARAAIALARHRPDEAIADLEPAHEFDFVSLEGISLRARAYLEANRLAEAEAEFRRILAHGFVAPVSPDIPLAHLGLARTLARENKPADARQEYQALFSLWRNADADLPPLVAARAEYARLQ